MTRMLALRLRACAKAMLVCTGLWLAGAGIAMACEPVALPQGARGPDLCYGRETWREPEIDPLNELHQRFDFYRVPSTAKVPLIVWAHPNGMSKRLPESSALYQALVAPALAAGFSFASLEFRHPVANEDEPNNANDPRIPHDDIARALQFIRANADALGIDRRNIFLVGQSRGSLGVWTALQDDMARPGALNPVLRESTRVNAVYAVNAQTTYDGAEFARLFVIEGDRDDFAAWFQPQYDHEDQFGSAIRSVSAGEDPDPPVRLVYDAPVVPRQLTFAEMMRQDMIHYTNFGPALCKAYLRIFGNGDRCSFVAHRRYRGDPAAAFAGYVDFFRAHRVP
jgi:acetyl esterase/lipase